MSEYIMNRESLKRHCEAMCHKFKNVPTSGAYSEHRLILNLLEQTEWIPVSERLPEKGYSVLVTRITDDNCKYARIASYQGDCWMDNTDEFNKPNPHKVIAWQPLSPCYEPQESEEQTE